MESIAILRHSVRIFEVIAFVVGLFYFKRTNTSYWKCFPFYIGLVAFIELMGWYFSAHKMYDENVKLYRFVGFPVQFIFLFWLYKMILELKDKIFVFCTIIYILSWVLEYNFLPKQEFSMMSVSFTVGNLILLILVFLYFYQLINSDKIITFSKQRAFWVSLGVLVYYLGCFPFYGLFNTLLKNFDLYLIYLNIVLVLGSLMYILFIASFIWGKEN